MPAVGAWSAPPATTGNRRPPLTFATSDPDGDAIDRYHVEVYQSVGGAPSGGPVYAAHDQTGGISAGSVTHTPTIDLPGGALLARSIVHAGPGGLWSDWSPWHAFTITLDAPAVSWVWPAVDGGYLPPVNMTDLAVTPSAVSVMTQIHHMPPAGQTATRIVIEWRYSSGGWFTIYDGAPGTTNGGYEQTWRAPHETAALPYGSGRVRWTLYASGGGSTTIERAWKASTGEWFGVTALGDGVTDLSAALYTHGGDDGGAWIMARNASDPVGPWRPIGEAATVQAELPAANAYLGLRTRVTHRAPDDDVIVNGYPDDLGLWRADSGGSVVLAGSGEGRHLLLFSDGTGQSRLIGDNYRNVQPVIGGAWYRWAARAGLGGGSTGLNLSLYLARADLSHISEINLAYSPAPWADQSVAFQAPADCAYVFIVGQYWGVPAAGANWGIQNMRVTGPIPGAAGLDRLDVSWRSLG
jgi:hypothetical protein